MKMKNHFLEVRFPNSVIIPFSTKKKCFSFKNIFTFYKEKKDVKWDESRIVQVAKVF